MTQKGKAYLRLIGKTEDASVVLTKGFAKQANELKGLGYATFIPISSGGCHVALTQAGIDKYDELFPEEEANEQP